MRHVLAGTVICIVWGALQPAIADEAVTQGGVAATEDIARLKSMVDELSLRVSNLERGIVPQAVVARPSQSNTVVKSYRVADLIPLAPGGYRELNQLQRYITAHLSPEQWEDAGGPGKIRRYEQNLSLVVEQTEEVHVEIAQWLSRLRDAQEVIRDYDEFKADSEKPLKTSNL